MICGFDENVKNGAVKKAPIFSFCAALCLFLLLPSILRRGERQSSDLLDCFVQYFVVQGSSCFVTQICGGAVSVYAYASCGFYGIHVGAEEEKLPTVFFLLPLYHLFYFGVAVDAAGVFHAVCCDDEERFFGTIFVTGVFVDVADVMDGAADGVEKCGAAADEIIILGKRFYVPDRNAIVDDIAAVVEENCGDKGFAVLLLLFFQHRVESSDGVLFKAAHGTAAVQNEYDFR